MSSDSDISSSYLPSSASSDEYASSPSSSGYSSSSSAPPPPVRRPVVPPRRRRKRRPRRAELEERARQLPPGSLLQRARWFLFGDERLKDLLPPKNIDASWSRKWGSIVWTFVILCCAAMIAVTAVRGLVWAAVVEFAVLLLMLVQLAILLLCCHYADHQMAGRRDAERPVAIGFVVSLALWLLIAIVQGCAGALIYPDRDGSFGYSVAFGFYLSQTIFMFFSMAPTEVAMYVVASNLRRVQPKKDPYAWSSDNCC